MDRTDSSASEHRDGGLGDHRQINRHPVALLDAPCLQRVREPAHRLVQLAVGDPAILARVVALPEDRGLLGTPWQMAIDAVVRRVEGPVLVPGDVHIALERSVPHLRKWFDPIDALAVLGPKSVGVVERLLVEPEIFGLADLADLRMGTNGDDGPPGHGVFPPRLPTLVRRTVCREYCAPLTPYNSRPAAWPLNVLFWRVSRATPPASGWRH